MIIEAKLRSLFIHVISIMTSRDWKNLLVIFVSVANDWRKGHDMPSAEPELIECDPVKACNEATMNKVFSAYRYLSMLEDLKVYGYVLAKRRTK